MVGEKGADPGSAKYVAGLDKPGVVTMEKCLLNC